MQLDYLDFDFSDEDSGRGSFDAMASVLPDRLQPLLAEIAAVLSWALRGFGAPGDDDAEWGYDLQGVIEPDMPLVLDFDGRRVNAEPAEATGRVTLTLTLGGTPVFCDALRARFGLE